MVTRICRKCGREKDIELFTKAKTCIGGRGWTCKQCINDNNKKWYKNNTQYKKEAGRKWINNNREHVRLKRHNNYLENKDRGIELGLKWRKENIERHREIVRRKQAKRRRIFGYKPINMKDTGNVGHHIDKNLVIYIPEGLHKSTIHTQDNKSSMKEINILAIQICYV